MQTVLGLVMMAFSRTVMATIRAATAAVCGPRPLRITAKVSGIGVARSNTVTVLPTVWLPRCQALLVADLRGEDSETFGVLGDGPPRRLKH